MATKVNTQAPVLAEKAPEPGEKPPEPTIKIVGLETLRDAPNTELKEVGDTVVEEYKPTEEDLANLAKNQTTAQAAAQPPTEPVLVERVTIIAPSVATRTMAEMKRGKEIVEAKTRMRQELLGG